MALQIRCFPTDDAAFRKTIARCLRSIEPTEQEQLATDVLRALDHLHSFYPLLRVRVADSLALTNGDSIVYVFRDGHALPTVNDGPGAMRARSRLAAAVIAAASVVDASRRFLARADTTMSNATVALGRRRLASSRVVGIRSGA